jgi:hypothetical protein
MHEPANNSVLQRVDSPDFKMLLAGVGENTLDCCISIFVELIYSSLDLIESARSVPPANAVPKRQKERLEPVVVAFVFALIVFSLME